MAAISTESTKNRASFIWSVADLLQEDCRQSEHGEVLPALVKQGMLDQHAHLQGKAENFGPILGALTDVDGLWRSRVHRRRSRRDRQHVPRWGRG